MQNGEMQELVRLLNVYQQELLFYADKNDIEARKHREDRWNGVYTHGIKAQYEHARLIAQKLSLEIERNINVY